MTDKPDITELDTMAQELRVRWRKANNYYRSFATMMFQTKDKFTNNPYGPEWTFSRWMFRKAGLPEDQVMKQLTVFLRVIAAEDRAKVEQENYRIAAEKRAAKKREIEERAAIRAAEQAEQAAQRQPAAAARSSTATKSAAPKRRRRSGGRRHDTRDVFAATANRTEPAAAPVVNGESDADLAQGIHRALDRVTGAERARLTARQEWIEGTLELAVRLGEARRRYPAKPQLGKWRREHNLGKDVIADVDFTALGGMARDLAATRIALEDSKSWSWQLIWRGMSGHSININGMTADGSEASVAIH